MTQLDEQEGPSFSPQFNFGQFCEQVQADFHDGETPAKQVLYDRFKSESWLSSQFY